MDKNYTVWASKENENTIHWGVQFTRGKYKEVVVEVLEFTSKDHQDGDTLGDILDEEQKINLSIEYQVIHNPDKLTREDFEAEEFVNMVSEAIGQIIKDTKEDYDKQNRILDIEESDQR